MLGLKIEQAENLFTCSHEAGLGCSAACKRELAQSTAKPFPPKVLVGLLGDGA